MIQRGSCQLFTADYNRERVIFKCIGSLDERINKLVIELENPEETTYSISIDDAYIQQQGQIFSTCIPSARKIYELLFTNFKDFVITFDGTIIFRIKLVLFHEEIIKTFTINLHNVTHIKQFGKSMQSRANKVQQNVNYLSSPFRGFPQHAGLLTSNPNMNSYWEKRLSGRNQPPLNINIGPAKAGISLEDLDFHSQCNHSLNFSLSKTQYGVKLTRTSVAQTKCANYVPKLKIENQLKIKIKITKSLNRYIFFGIVSKNVINSPIPYKHPEAILYSCNGDVFEKETCWPTMIKPEVQDEIVLIVNLPKRTIDWIVKEKRIPTAIPELLIQNQLHLMVSMLSAQDQVEIMII